MWIICGGVTLLLLALSARYGFYRDELYFIVAGRRLDWGFVDQPPLTPFIAGALDALPGQITPTVLRILPAIATGAVALIAALLARRFGGSQLAMALAAAAVGGSSMMLILGHLLTTQTVEIFLSALLILGVARLLDGADLREWLWVGLIAGLAGMNKLTVVGIIAALAVGILLSPGRRVLFSWWAVAAGGLALLVVFPTLLWQAANGWPQLEMAAAIQERYGRLEFARGQLSLLSVILVIPAFAGWLRLLRIQEGRWRAFPFAAVITVAAYLIIGGQSYYAAPMYIPLLAAGACWVATLKLWPRAIIVTICVFVMGFFAFTRLPLFPEDELPDPSQFTLIETIGWPEMVDQVAAVVETLPEDQREEAAIVTGNYGEASALLVLGEDMDLPPVVSGVNNFGLWGPPEPDRNGPIVAVGGAVDQLTEFCPDMFEVDRIQNDAGVANGEQGQPIAVCPALDETLATIWPELRFYG